MWFYWFESIYFVQYKYTLLNLSKKKQNKNLTDYVPPYILMLFNN